MSLTYEPTYLVITMWNIIINVILHLYILETQPKETEVLQHKSGQTALFLWTTHHQIQYIQLYVTNRGAIY
jgi:hypothetical protein